MKNKKIYTRLLGAFIIIDVIFLCLIFGSLVMGKVLLTVDNPEAYYRKYPIYCVVMVVVMLVLMSAVTTFFGKLFRVSFKNLAEAAQKLSKGETDVKLVKDADDEMGLVIDKFNQVVDNAQYQAAIMEEVANGNLTVEVKTASEKDALGNAIDKMVSRNRHALSGINDSASLVLTSASEVAGASEALAQGSTEQASAIEQITVSISDIADKTKMNAEKADAAKQLMSETLTDVEAGNEQMKSMTEAMAAINKSSESIFKIIKVIDDIAFQTNILALNAAVEAARAGEAGKGFAVVAEEVRNLAAKSSQAASETAELIEDSIQKISTGSSYAENMADSLERMTKIVTESADIIADIAEASNYQAVAINQVNIAIEQVSEVVQTNSATSQQCAAASVELSSQAKRMKELLSVYRLEGNPGRKNTDIFG